MKDYSNYRPPLKETLVWSNKKLFQYYLDFEGVDVLIDNVPTRAIVRSHSNPYNEDKEERKFLCDLDVQIKRGSIVDYDGSKWLVFSDVDIDEINKSTKILKCNDVLRLNKKGILSEVPYIVMDNTALTRMGLDNNKFFNVPDSKMMLVVPDNEHTRLIQRDEIFTLYNIDNIKDNYKIIDINRIRKSGLIIFEIEWTPEEQQLPNYSIRILNGDNLKVNVADILILNCEVFDGDKVLSHSPQLVYHSDNEEIAIIDNNGVITALDTGIVTFIVSLQQNENIKTMITVEFIEEEQHNYVATITGSTSIVKGKTATYTVLFTNNGVPINIQSEFWLTDDNGNPTSFAVISSQDSNANTCVITAGNTLGYVKLWCKSIDGNIISEPLRIQIKNIF